MDEQTLLHRAPLAVIEVDATLRVTGWNQRAQRLFSFIKNAPQAAAAGQPLAELLPLTDTMQSWSTLLTADAGTSPRVWPVGDTPQNVLLFEAWTQVHVDDTGAVTGATLYGHDATTRITAERQASLETTMLEALKEHLDVVMWAIDRRGTFLYQDGKGLRAAGLTSHQFVGQSIFDIYKDSGVEDVRQALAGHAQIAVPGENHGMHWQSWHLPVGDALREAAVVGITLDVTEARRTELELRGKLELIERQQAVISELSTPIIEVWDGVLTLPIVGLVDSVRTAEIMDNLLTAVTKSRARFAILDLTGVEVVDTGTAGHLIGMIQAIRLLGAEGILTGIHPTIAQTIVALGVDLAHVAVYATLRDALQHCIVQMQKKKKLGR